MTWAYIVGGVALTGVGIGAYLRSQVEEAPYTVLASMGAYEIRDYPNLTLVESSCSKEESDNFGRLFKYIQGANDEEQKIPMTAPVFMQYSDSGIETMSFVMPEDMDFEDTPMPKNSRVSVKQSEGGQYAVYRYKGRNNSKREAKALDALQEWVQLQEFPCDDQATFAGYDSPMVPGFMRRNEVLLKLTTDLDCEDDFCQ